MTHARRIRNQATCLGLCVLALALLFLLLPGCAVGRTQFGEDVIGFNVSSANALAAGMFPWEKAFAIGGAALAVVGGGAGIHYRTKRNYERSGWDEAAGTPGTPPQARPLDKPLDVPTSTMEIPR